MTEIKIELRKRGWAIRDRLVVPFGEEGRDEEINIYSEEHVVLVAKERKTGVKSTLLTDFVLRTYFLLLISYMIITLSKSPVSSHDANRDRSDSLSPLTCRVCYHYRALICS